jgi:pyruvate formate-lyase activating enzyme-like uncharacterized protein
MGLSIFEMKRECVMFSYYEQMHLMENEKNKINELHSCDYGLTSYYGEDELSPGCLSCKAGTWLCLYVTKSCNLNCIYCPQSDKTHNIKIGDNGEEETSFLLDNKRINISPETFECYLKQRIESIDGISYSGGEPFMALDKIVRLAKLCNQINPNIYQWIYTNGVYVNEDILKRLRDLNIQEIRFDWSAQQFNSRLLYKMELAAKQKFKVTVEVPMYDRDVIRNKLLPQLSEMVSAGVSQLNCAELMITSHNQDRLNICETELYRHAIGRKSPVWSRPLTYEIIRKVEEVKLNLVVNDCSNDAKLLQSIQRDRRMEPEKKYLQELINISFGTGDEEILLDELKKSNLEFLDFEFKRQELEGYIYRRFKDSPFKLKLPPKLLSKWKSEYAGIAVRNILFENEINNIIREFDSKGLDYIVLNGFAFAEERLAFRTIDAFNNLDIMIRRADFGRIGEILLGNNFIVNGKNSDDENLNIESVSTDRYEKNISFSKKIGVVSLKITVLMELNAENYEPLSVTDKVAVPFDELTDYIIQSSFASVQFKSLDSTAYFAYLLSRYAMSKQYSGLKWLVEICMLVHSCGELIQWRKVEYLCERLGCQKIFYLIREVVAAIIGKTDPALRKWNINEAKLPGAGEIEEFKTLLNYPGMIPKNLNIL